MNTLKDTWNWVQVFGLVILQALLLIYCALLVTAMAIYAGVRWLLFILRLAPEPEWHKSFRGRERQPG